MPLAMEGWLDWVDMSLYSRRGRERCRSAMRCTEARCSLRSSSPVESMNVEEANW